MKRMKLIAKWGGLALLILLLSAIFLFTLREFHS